jgi:CDGSH-type Zn-finger protein
VAAGFTASGEPVTAESTPLAQRNGPLNIKPLLNGPLLVTGNVEVVTGTGRTIHRTQKMALCRCGASANKPYCDGSHSRVGFSSE